MKYNVIMAKIMAWHDEIEINNDENSNKEILKMKIIMK